ncbi:MAG TPA: HD domain-containing protein, partial [Desulfobacteraceae bacterium]|nr:HD domain-containing protein [Desulfobacteraceae bacterium]
IIVSDIKAYEGEEDPAVFLESAAGDITAMITSLRGILQEIEDTHFKALSERFLADHHFMELFKKAPAAKNFHHNYVGGLLEHTLSVCRMSLHAAEQYGDLDRDLLVTGSFLHDIGKIREFKYNRMIEYTDEGRLLGHLVMGISMVDEKLAKIRQFPGEKALLLKHLILSHHGQYEFGSPKRPKFLEAFALHLIDDLDAKMNGLRRYMERDNLEGAWTDFNRMFERYLLKNRLPEVERQEDDPRQDDRQKALFTP